MPQRTLTLLILTLIALPAFTSLAAAPARADQVPANSGFYMHVGDDLLHTTGALQMTNPLASDGNETSGVVLASPTGNAGSFSGGCTAATTGVNSTVAVANAPVVDMIHYTGVYNWGAPGGFGTCVTMGIAFTDGSTITLYGPAGAGAGDTVVTGYVNFTAKAVSAFWIASGVSGCNCAGITRTHIVREFNGWLKNSTVSDPVYNIAKLAAGNEKCLSTTASATNFASSTYTVPQGTSYVMIPAAVNFSATTGAGAQVDSMQLVQTVGSGGLTFTYMGVSKTTADITGARNGATQIWKVVATQSGLGIAVKTFNTNVATTQTICRYERVDDMYSSTYLSGYVFANLAAWGGTASDIWGVVYAANGYPINPVYDTDLSGTGSLFSQDNMTFGAQLFASGTSGQSTTISLNTLPVDSHEGNGILLALGQSTTAVGSSTAYTIFVNGYPANPIAYGTSTTNAYKYALFYVDDVAVRNGLANSAGNVGQSWSRPLSAESYQITLGSGFDTTKAVYAGNTYGRDGHAGIQCLTLCGSNLWDQYAILPQNNHNSIQFHVVNRTGVPLSGVRVMNSNTTDTRTTDANGRAWFNDSFGNAVYRVTLTNYVSLCADYYFRAVGGTISGTAADGCPYLQAFNATYEVTMATNAESGLGFDGTIGVGGGGTGKPTQPQSNSVVAANYGLAQSWNPPGDNGGSAITRYDVYRGSSSGMVCDSGSLVGSVDASTFTYPHTGLAATTTYYVRVVAENANGVGTCAPPVAATTNDAPTQPQGVGANVVIGGIEVSWSPPANNGTAGGSLVDDYRVWYADGANVGCGGTSTFVDLSSTTNVWNYTLVQTGHTYYFYPQAHSPVGWGVCSPGASATYNLYTSAPPTSFSVTNTVRGRVYVNWSLPADQGSFPVNGYWIYRGSVTGAGGGSCAPPSALTFVANTSSPQSFVDLNAPVNTQNLYYKVSATNAAGEGSCTNPLGAEAIADPPTQPQDVRVSVFAGRNQVTWIPPADDGGTPIAQYRVWYMDQADGGCGASSQEVTLPASQQSFNDTTYTPHVARYYYVQALSQLVGVCSPPGSGVTNNVGKPSAPASLTTTTSLPRFVWLNWTQPADNGGLGVTNFYIYRTSDATTNACSSTQTLAYVLSGTNATWKDFSVLDGITYHYRVSAVNQAGEGPCTGALEGKIDPYGGQSIALSADATSAANGVASLTWNTIDGADAYNVYRALDTNVPTRPMNASQYHYALTVASPSFAENVSTTTHYRVVATSTQLGEGPVSDDAEVDVCQTQLLTSTIGACGNLTRVVPDRVNIQLQRTAPQDVLLTVVKYDPLSGTFSPASSSLSWKTTDPDVITAQYPADTATSATDAGAYSLILHAGTKYLARLDFRIVTDWATANATNLPRAFAVGEADELAATLANAYDSQAEAAHAAALAQAEGSVNTAGALEQAVILVPVILLLVFVGLLLRNVA